MRRLAGRVRAADLWTVALALTLLWPLRRAGYPLGRDLVFTPRQPLSADSLGLGSASPRAVPLDAIVALASKALDGAVIGRLALLLPLVAAGCAAWRVSRPTTTAGALAAAAFAVWNPFVIERLALGQWALLWAYGALGWLWLASIRIRRDFGSPLAWCAAVLALAACSITPTGGLVGAAVFCVAAVDRVGRRLAAVLAVALVLQLPWLVPALSAPAGATSDPSAVAAFASRSERGGGVLLSLLGLGGIWDSGSTPGSRAGALGYLTTLVLAVCLICGGAELWHRLEHRDVLRLAALAVTGFVLAAVTALPGGAAFLRWTVGTLPGAGLLRDGQKWLMPYVFFAVVCVGATVDLLARRLATVKLLLVMAAMFGPLLLLPDAPATLKPTLTPVHYPAGWYRAAAAVRGDGDVLALPFASYRSFAWLPATSVIDPAPRWLSRPVVVDDRLVVGGRQLLGEDRRAAAISRILATDARRPARLADDLAAEGIGWVWVETGSPGPPTPDLSGLRLQVGGSGVDLYRVPGTVRKSRISPVRWITVVIADLLAVGLVLTALAVSALSGARACYTRR